MTSPMSNPTKLLLLDSSPEQTIEVASHLGYSGVEIACSDGCVTSGREWADKLSTRCQELGLSLAVHAPSIDLHLDSPNLGIRRESIAQINSTLSLFAGHAEYVTIHTNYARRFAKHGSLERLANSLQEITALACELEVCVAVENVYEQTIDELLTYLDLLDSSSLRFVIDVGHAHAYGALDASAALEVLGDRIAAVHLSDNVGNDDQHLALGDGSAPIAQFLSKLGPAVSRTVEARNRLEAARSFKFLSTWNELRSE